MIKIVIDAGHGMNTAGKRVLKSLDKNETREWALNSRVANYVESYLKEYEGYELMRVDDRTGKVDIPLVTRTKKSNDWKADIYLSIHHNAGINGGSGGGITVYRYPNSSKMTKAMLERLYDLLIKHTGLKGNRAKPLNDTNFQVLRQTNAPAVLIENGFMDSKVDVPIILSDSHARKTANAIVSFLVGEFKLKKKATTKPSIPSTSPQPPKKSVTDIAKEVIAGKWGNGADRKNRLEKAGYNYQAVQDEVNKILTGGSPVKKKSTNEIAREVINGKWGNGVARKNKLEQAGYNYKTIQAEVNKLLK